MHAQVEDVARRIKSLRDDLAYSIEEMAEALDMSPEEYARQENEAKDYSFTFLYRTAEKLGVDMIDLLTGEGPHLQGYSLMRAGDGLSIKRREGFEYLHLAPHFKSKLAEPFYVTAPFIAEEQDQPIARSSHVGQEINFIVKGQLLFAFEDHIETLNPGDTVYYNSNRPHGMIATGGEDCEFLAIVLKGSEDE